MDDWGVLHPLERANVRADVRTKVRNGWIEIALTCILRRHLRWYGVRVL
jgi:hypothetical protein